MFDTDSILRDIDRIDLVAKYPWLGWGIRGIEVTQGIQYYESSVAVGTGLRFGLGPPPAQIPACTASALGSWLGSGRRIARRARDA